MAVTAWRKLFGASGTPSTALSCVLRPLEGWSKPLYERCLAYVHDGSQATALDEVERAQGPELADLMGCPASLRNWWYPRDETEKALASVGMDAAQVHRARRRYYASPAEPGELVRFARVLAALAGDVDRQAPGVPLWLTVLLNDVIGTLSDHDARTGDLARRFPRWNARFVVELLETQAYPRTEAESLALLALIQKPVREYYRRIDPSDLPGVDALLISRGLSVSEAAALSAKARVWLMERARRVPAVGATLAEVVAALTVDPAKGPRAAALHALTAVPEATRTAVLRPVLAAPPARAVDLVDVLSRNHWGTSLLVEAAENGAPIAHLREKAAQRGKGLDDASALTDGAASARTAAAARVAAQGSPDDVPRLREALAKEKHPLVRLALLAALEQLGDDISDRLTPAVLTAEAASGLRAKPPASMSWLDLDALPAVHWADGSPVDPAVPRWWFVLAVKRRNPDGSGLFDRYLSLLDAANAATMGRLALEAWVGQDTRRPEKSESRAQAEEIGPESWQEAQDLAKRLRRKGKYYDPGWLSSVEQRAALPVEHFVEEAFRELQAVYVGSAIADKGLLALTTRMPGAELAGAVQAYIRHHGGRRAQVEALVHALFANGEAASIQLLLSISRRFGQVTVQAKAAQLAQRLAEERGWTAEELADRTIPTAGFDDDGLLRLSYGERVFTGRLNARFGIDLTGPDGTPVKTLPAPRVSDDPEAVAEAKKRLATARKELKAVLTLHTARFYEAMCDGRTWSAPVWRELLWGHPLMSHLVSRLIWTETGKDGQRRFRPRDDGELIGVDGRPLVLGEESEVRLAHRVHLDDEEADLWRTRLAEAGIAVPFDQLGATVPRFAEGTEVLDDLQGHLSGSFRIRGVATRRGYSRGSVEDAGWFAEYTKAFSASGLTAVLAFTGSYLPEDDIACATESLSFRRGHSQVPLQQVPEVLLAECYADYAALAALGPFDPGYEEKVGR